ncbi:DUF1206 domain-containing protein [Nocardioides nitrophenolicus]|uniref:DUF1206 domain-containing protein n=1 Tax=Nocardioides nitrophenolicus TaxID=60489 RepID=UPI001961D83D|nr:DUF1206 domain-containing protein [Nocardioides nitrophenolicus]MBM7520429.1 hypothetical protein [Nocardioides nitrophenolicus]
MEQGTERAARETRDHPAVTGVARAGMAAYGVVYVIVGWLAAQLALGHPDGSASGQGALEQLRDQPLGAVVLWLVAVGLAGLVVWELCQAVGGHRDQEGARRWLARAVSAGRGVVFAVLAVLAVRTASGGGASGGGSGGGGLTGRLLALPVGPAMVVLVGLGIAGVGVFSIVHAMSDRWRRGVEPQARAGTLGSVVTALARIGFATRGVAFLVLAGMFAWSGVTHDPSKSGGLDQAIVRFRDEPYGPAAMVVVALGLGCYGLFHVLRAAFLRED